ncbi:MAG TPA: sigma-54-dependent Fis family transcriptional regulator, partial [Desulfobacterales bacterium]|nr:sigma-54-dependent Fis family transcriptional regulator [Desulfobacterales bacterium]
MTAKKQNMAKPARQKVLVVDDDPLIRIGLEKLLEKEGYEPVAVGTGRAALEQLDRQDFSLALLDLKLPDSYDGLSLLGIIKKTRPNMTVVMISGQTEVRSAVEAMKLGAFDYLEKPIDFERLRNILHDLRPTLPDKEESDSPFDDLIYTTDAMKRVVDLMRRLATKSDITILMLGESGTGKNFLCQKLHEMSPRRDFPYVQIGCANIPEHLIESELFGYEKGAFTDAKNSKKGLVEIAEGGTILLDELGE